MGPEGIILVNSPITTFRQSLTHSGLSGGDQSASCKGLMPRFTPSALSSEGTSAFHFFYFTGLTQALLGLAKLYGGLEELSRTQ